MPDPISNLGQLVEVLRRQLSNRPEAERATTRSVTPKSADKPKASSGRENIETSIRDKVSVIDRDDPDRRKKIIRIFIESVLYQEFGEGVIHDPRLYSLASEIQQSMEGDPLVLTKLNQLADELMQR